MKHRIPGTKFSPVRELRKNFNKFPNKTLGAVLSTEEYVKLYCKNNLHIPSTYIIYGREVSA